MPSWVMLRAVLFVTLRSTSCPNHSRKFVSLKDCGSPLPPPSLCCHAADYHYDTSLRRNLSYLLHKHPDRFQSFDLSFGQAHVFYPEVRRRILHGGAAARCGPGGHGPGQESDQSFLLAHYVNDRPYVASSFMSVAISQVLRLGPGRPLQGSARVGRDADCR